MYVTNFKIHNIDFPEIKKIINREINPSYSITIDNVEIYYLEDDNSDRNINYLSVVTIAKKKEEVVVSIVTGKKKSFLLSKIGMDKISSLNKKILNCIEMYINDFNSDAKVVTIDDNYI